MTDAVSVPLTGTEFKGRLFFLEHPAAVVDSLFTAEIIAGELLARMGSVRVVDRLRDAALKDQRMRMALELHDGLLQSLTAAGLELATAARELPPELADTRIKLQRAERILSGGKHELRALIDEMRPGRQGLRPFDLGSRLTELQEFLAQQWSLRVKITADAKCWHSAQLLQTASPERCTSWLTKPWSTPDATPTHRLQPNSSSHDLRRPYASLLQTTGKASQSRGATLWRSSSRLASNQWHWAGESAL